MKVLFAGPSLHGLRASDQLQKQFASLEWRGPAAQGDIARAVVEGASAIGLVDGRYEDIAAVWHKEILYAISEGVTVLGGASMGALRAAECADFGMLGVGAVFDRYRSGELEDDAAVAQLHAPEELDYAPVTEALVNVEATIGRFGKLLAISEDEAGRLDAAARRLFFKERTWSRIIREAGLQDGARGKRLGELVRCCKVDVKREDALTLAGFLAWLEPMRGVGPSEWTLRETSTWRLTLDRAARMAGKNLSEARAA